MKNFLAQRAVAAPAHLLSTSKAVSQDDIERVFARCFSTEDGRKVLAHLQVMTFSRAYGPEVANETLRYAEGQRALVATILRMVDRGRK